MATAKKQAAAKPPAAARRRQGKKPQTPERTAKRVAYRTAQNEIIAQLNGKPAKSQLSVNGKTILVVQGDSPRPTKFDAELATRVCMMFATDPYMSLNKLNLDPTLPTAYTMYSWLDNQPSFARAYARAREIQYDLQAEQLNDVARTPLIGTIKVTRTGGKDGGSTETREHDNVDRARLMVDTQKWLLSKSRPKKYGAAPSEVESNDALQSLLGEFRARNKMLGADPNADS